MPDEAFQTAACLVNTSSQPSPLQTKALAFNAFSDKVDFKSFTSMNRTQSIEY